MGPGAAKGGGQRAEGRGQRAEGRGGDEERDETGQQRRGEGWRGTGRAPFEWSYACARWFHPLLWSTTERATKQVRQKEHRRGAQAHHLDRPHLFHFTLCDGRLFAPWSTPERATK